MVEENRGRFEGKLKLCGQRTGERFNNNIKEYVRWNIEGQERTINLP